MPRRGRDQRGVAGLYVRENWIIPSSGETWGLHAFPWGWPGHCEAISQASRRGEFAGIAA